jgi:hypothetical protein
MHGVEPGDAGPDDDGVDLQALSPRHAFPFLGLDERRSIGAPSR